MDIRCLEGLRGCGGAGFAAAFKWEAVRREAGGDKVVICNADEGEPGTFKDGWLLRHHVQTILRGMQKAAQHCGATRGFVYLRPEYQAHGGILLEAIAALVEEGLLSAGSGQVYAAQSFPGRPAVLASSGLSDCALASLDWHVQHGAQELVGQATAQGGVELAPPSHGYALPPRESGPIPPAPSSGHPFRLDLCWGGGAYICGEETALLESMEGRRPQPRHKPPFPTQSGLWGLPTLINNVETFWWAERLLTGDCKTPAGSHRLYSVSGAVQRPGVYEAPVGLSARALVEDFAGGLREGAEVSCWIPGGAATGILPGSLLDTPLSPDGLSAVGTAPGTAAVVIYSQPTDPRTIAAQIMRFFAQESCSQCTPCRLGCRAAAAWLEGSEAFPQVEVEAQWLEAMELGSICGLGFTAPLVLRQWRRWFCSAEVPA